MQSGRSNTQKSAKNNSKRTWQRRPQLERLESREMFAIYLPDSFAKNTLQPVGTAFNNGEQIFFGGHSGGLQFEFGNSLAGSNYNGTGWNQRDVDTLVPAALPDVAGTPSLYTAPAGSSGSPQLHAVYRSTGDSLIDVWASPWQSQTLVSSGVASDPTAANFGGGRQVLYVGDDGHVHLVASADYGATWYDTDLTSWVGLGSDPSAVAVASSGVAALQVGSYQYYVYHRADGQLGYFVLSSGGWGYDSLDAADLPGYIAPTSGARGVMEGVSYSTTGSGTSNAGWVMYRDAAGLLRGVWLAGSSGWQTANLSTVPMLGAPSAAYDASTGKLNVAFIDNNAHLRLAREGNTWTTLDFHASDTISMPLSNVGAPDIVSGNTQAGGTITLANAFGGAGSFVLTAVSGGAADGVVGNATDIVFTSGGTSSVQATGTLSLINSGGSLSISAVAGTAADGAKGNATDFVFVVGGTTTAGYDPTTNQVTVSVAAGATLSDVVAAISGLAEFNATLSTGTGTDLFNVGDLTTYTNPLSGGTDAVSSASYNAATNTITVAVAPNATIAGVAAAIHGLAAFNVSGIVNGSSIFNAADFGTRVNPLSGGGSIITPGAAVKPDIYHRSFSTSSGGPGIHVLYKDQSNHVHNVNLIGNNAIVFDTTAFMEGYRGTYGYGIVNAAAAVAYALNSSTPLNGAGGGAWNLSLIRAPSVWSTATGQNTAVFALDSGIDAANADLVLLTGYNAAAGNTNTSDTVGHGTEVAGIIAGLKDSHGVTGVAYNSRVVPVKIGDGSIASEQAIIDGINYATNYVLPSGYNATTRVLNMSFASTSTTMFSLRNKMYEKSPNTVFVAAAGNRTQSSVDAPAVYNVGFGIVAGAINSASQLWSPTNGPSGAATPYNYLLAPGVAVTTSTLVGSSGNNYNTATVNGTSAAAAHISGVIALMLEANPNLTAREVESILIASADQVVTQTVSATAPSISGVIYFAGDEGTTPAAAMLGDGPAKPLAEIPSEDTSDAPANVVSESAPELPACPTYDMDAAILAAMDEDFDPSQSDGDAELLDLMAESQLGVI